MKTCEHLRSGGKCEALKILVSNTGEALKIEHLPKFALATGDRDANGKFIWVARCVLAEEPENQRHCDDFKQIKSNWRDGLDIPPNCQPSALY